MVQEGVDEGVIGEKELFVLVVGGNTVGVHGCS